ncbi:TPA: hypothetical protein ACH3X2_001179 [Trebouxia sp. C0005]
MTTCTVSAIEGSRQLYAFFFSGRHTITLQDIRYLEDNLTVIDFYLKKKRAELEHIYSKKADEYKLEIRDGHVGDHVSNDGAGRDYELPTSQTDGQLVESNTDGAESCCGESSGM